MAEGNYLVGVDIGSSGIKLCHLKDVRGKKTLVKFGYHPLPPQSIVEGHVRNTAAVVDGINALFNNLKIKRREVALAVSGHAVIIKRLALPMMTDAELIEQIPWGPSSTSRSTSRMSRSTTRCCVNAPSRDRWTCSSSPRRKKRSTRRLRSPARPSSNRW
jgi:hypothetical protein